MSYAMTTAQANRAMGWTKPKLRAYWDARARACQEMGDEGECLAQVAKHVPVTLGLGQANVGTDVASVLSVTAGLLSNPDATLRFHGPRLVAAADQHLIEPVVQRLGRSMAPYAMKYVLPPIAVLYVLTGLSTYYSYKVSKKMAPNRSRRRRRRR